MAQEHRPESGNDGELDALLDAAVDAIIVIDHRGIIRRFSVAAQEMFGYSAAQAVGRNVNLLMPEPYRSEHDGYLEHHLDTGEARIIGIGRDVTAQRADGSVFPVRLSVGRVSGEPPRFVGIIHDTTDQKTIETALRQERDRAQSYLEVAEVMLLGLDVDGRVILVNRKGCEILGLEQHELVGRDWFSTCIPPAARDGVRAEFQAVVRGSPGTEVYENPILTRSGDERLIAWQHRVMYDEHGGTAGTLSSGEDITEHRRNEKESQLAKARLAHVSRLSTLGEMAAGLAHEINQPLTAIATYAQACQRIVPDEGDKTRVELRRALEQISQQALRAGAVIDRLRAMIRDRQAQRTAVDCNQLVRATRILAETDTRANAMQLVLDLPDETPSVWADEVQVQQVLLNLIRNAIDAGDENMADRRIIVRVRACHDEVEVAVIDHGRGVPPDTGEELFEAFHTTKEHGTGLGLAISRSIVRAHGGDLTFQHNRGPGTTFLFTLPAR